MNRDGMMDLVFLTSKKTMNFVVNYNRQAAPKYKLNNPRANLTEDHQNLCADTNRNISDIGPIFSTYASI